jgi:SAM-dependent methyltransferase
MLQPLSPPPAGSPAPPQAPDGAPRVGEAPAADMAGQGYWDRLWDETSLPAPIDPRAAGLRYHVRRELHALFRRFLPAKGAAPARLLEVGCARSAWLPYFAREFACEVAGLDYSPLGCRQSEEMLRRAGVPGEVACADLFDPPPHMKGAFDFVVTFGVVEHFDDTAACIAALGAFLRPGGRVITIIPNNAGAVGWLQRVVNRPVFDLHVVLDREQLAAAHRGAGLAVEHADYLVSTHFAVTNLNGVPAGTPSFWAKRLFRTGFIAASAAVWVWEERVRPVRPGRALSPYVACVARRD